MTDKSKVLESIENMVAYAVEGDIKSATDIFNQIVSQRASEATERVKYEAMSGSLSSTPEQ